MTPERVRKIIQCRRDIFYKATVPLTVLTGIASFIGLKAGIIPRIKSGINFQVFSSALTTAVIVETYCNLLCFYKKYPDVDDIYKPPVDLAKALE
jgi:hypothetical protein